MRNQFTINKDQIPPGKQLLYHFYPGVAILIFYVFLSPVIIDMGYPGLAALLLAEILILMPIGISHLMRKGYQLNHRISFSGVIGYTNSLDWKTYIKWTFIGIFAIVIIYIPLFPVGLWAKERLFFWLPEWYFNPGFGQNDTKLLANLFLIGIVTDGIIAPVVEELYFRGYLLPRMKYLKKWAPILNGILFGLYHFWQPHNYPAIIGVGIILSYIVWRKKNIFLGILIHCIINIIGSIGGYIAATGGIAIDR